MKTAFLILVVLLISPVVTAGEELESRTIDNLFKEGADAYNKRKDYATALERMSQVLEADPDYDPALYYRARVYLSKGYVDLDKASEDAERALALRPDEQRYVYLKGRVFEKRGETQPAIEWYSKALDKGFHSESLRGRIRLYLEIGEYEKALADCDWLYQHEPKSETRILRARALLGLDRCDQALAECNKVITYKTEDKVWEKGNAREYMARAQVYIKLGEYEKAHFDLATASWLEREEVEPILKLGDFFMFHQPDYRQAIAYYTAVIEVDDLHEPKSAIQKERHERPIARLRRGQAYLALDAKLFGKKALADFTRYIKLEPDEPQGYAERAKLYLASGENDKALADIRTALELDPDNAQYRDIFDAIGGTAEGPDTPRGDQGTDTTESEEAPQ